MGILNRFFKNPKVSKLNLIARRLSNDKRVKPLLLVSLDGWGIAPDSKGNAISTAKTPNMDRFWQEYPHTELIASGESVGLPANEEGNSEVGHLTMGAGRVQMQSLKRIQFEIDDESFYKNEAFLKAAEHVIKNKSRLHLAGLVGSGSVHSSTKHFNALVEFAKRQGMRNIGVHLFTDGRDAPPEDGIEVIKNIQTLLNDNKMPPIATVSGRYYAMDRDLRWSRTEKTYNAMVLGQGTSFASAADAVNDSYKKQKTDEFVVPSVITKNGAPVATINDNDAIIFFNFRADRMRQLTSAFAYEKFETVKFKAIKEGAVDSEAEEAAKNSTPFIRKKKLNNLFIATMTEYDKEIPVSAIAYPPLIIIDSMAEILSARGAKQIRISESEKEKMVTYYFDGLKEDPFPNEDVLIVPSPKVSTYDKIPEMSAYEVCEEVLKSIDKGIYHFLMMNFANADMVAHTGDVKATIEACETVDSMMGILETAILAVDGVMIVTADHGNAEELLDFPKSAFFFSSAKGEVNTDHSNSPVPFIVVGNQYKGNDAELEKGTLADVSTTILPLLNIQPPERMKGKNLLTTMKKKTENPNTVNPKKTGLSTPNNSQASEKQKNSETQQNDKKSSGGLFSRFKK